MDCTDYPVDYKFSEMSSKENKNLCSAFEKEMKMHCYSLKNQDDALFNNSSKRPAFVLKPLKTMLNFELEILSLQQLEYEMYRTGHPNFPYAHIQLEQATNLILSHF